MPHLRPTLAVFSLLATPAMAEVPLVVTDIAPVHSLVSMVMQGVGQPDLLIPARSSPHDFSLRPSDAARLQDADLIVWIGEDLTPWLARPLSIVAEGAVNMPLIELPVTLLREGGHEHDTLDVAAHAGDDHDDHDDHDEEMHGSHDPHVWLDPVNAIAWLPEIASALTRQDPQNGPLYSANAANAADMLDQLLEELAQGDLARPFIVSHDAFGYFEDRFDAHALGSIAGADASAPGPARVAALRDAAREADVRCVLVEPQFNSGLAEAVVPQGVTIRQIDAMGSDLPLGATLYPDMIRSIAAAISGCPDE